MNILFTTGYQWSCWWRLPVTPSPQGQLCTGRCQCSVDVWGLAVEAAGEGLRAQPGSRKPGECVIHLVYIMYVYIYMVYVCMYMYTHMICVCIYVYMMYVYICVYTYDVCVCLYSYVYIHIYTYIHRSICTPDSQKDWITYDLPQFTRTFGATNMEKNTNRCREKVRSSPSLGGLVQIPSQTYCWCSQTSSFTSYFEYLHLGSA